MENFFSDYLSYVADSEPPVFYHRWAAIATVGALLSRRVYYQQGHMLVHPNIYCMLIGVAATKKTTAIKMIKRHIKNVGYRNIAADKTTKEKFLIDLSGKIFIPEEPFKKKGKNNGIDILNENLWGTESENENESVDETKVSETFIMADEFNEFFGNSILDFVALLGNLWDYEGTYENKIKNSASDFIPNPTISILGGNTPTSFSRAFPPEIIGQGFFSRVLLIYGEPTDRKITFPEDPTPEQIELISYHFKRLSSFSTGRIEVTLTAKRLLDKIYKTWKGMEDVRFDSYANRRFTHLIKLCLIHAAAMDHKEITESVVIVANTILSHTEHLMPKALGEFGKAKYSDTSHKILQIIEGHTDGIITLKQIWKLVHNDLDGVNQLSDLLRKLVAADKVQSIKNGFLPKISVMTEVSSDLVNYSLLSEEERRYIK